MQFGRTKTIKIYAKNIPELKGNPCFGIPEILPGTAWRDFEATWHWGQYSLGSPVALDVESNEAWNGAKGRVHEAGQQHHRADGDNRGDIVTSKASLFTVPRKN